MQLLTLEYTGVIYYTRNAILVLYMMSRPMSIVPTLSFDKVLTPFQCKEDHAPMIESLLLTDDQKMFRQVIRDWCQKEFEPNREEYVKMGSKEWPWEEVMLRQLGKLGVLGLRIPEEYGGAGGGVVDQVILFEEGGRYQAPFPLTSISATCKKLAEFGSEELKRKWLPRLARGDVLGAFAQSEPDAGSDAPAMRSTAVQDCDDWVINGTKRWITNSEYADVFFVVAYTDPTRRGDGIGA